VKDLRTWAHSLMGHQPGREPQRRPDHLDDPDRPLPNLLLIMTDQQRWDGMGCVGGWVDTPNMDRLAAQGVRFNRAYTNSPVCVPARVSLATGRYPHNNGVWLNSAYTLPPTSNTWMRSVRDAGYATSLFGKTHLHPQRGDLRDREHLLHSYGLDHVDEIAGPRASVRSRSNLTDRWEEAGLYEAYKRDLKQRYATKPWVARPSPLPLEHYPDVYVGQQAASYLHRYSDELPWFCWVSFSGPHEPWDAPEPYASRYDPAAMPLPAQVREDGHQRPTGILDQKLHAAGDAPTPDDVARLRANYAGNISLIDDQIGAVLDVIAARGELDRTVVALVSDHGEMNGDHGLLYKQNFLDPAARVPFVIRVPPGYGGGAAGRVTEAPIELMDVGATFVELAGGAPDRASFAQSACPLLDGSTEEHRGDALVELRHEVMLATPDWKIGLNRRREAYLLFDLDADPQETTNLAALPDHAQVERGLKRQLVKRLSRSK
jgi:arylsulfatase